MSQISSYLREGKSFSFTMSEGGHIMMKIEGTVSNHNLEKVIPFLKYGKIYITKDVTEEDTVEKHKCLLKSEIQEMEDTYGVKFRTPRFDTRCDVLRISLLFEKLQTN